MKLFKGLLAATLTLMPVAAMAAAQPDISQLPVNIDQINALVTQNLQAGDKKAQIQVVIIAIRVLAFLLGVSIFIGGLLRFKKNAESPNSYPIGSAIAMVISGTLLISIGTFYQVISGSIDPNLVGSSNNILSLNKHIGGFEGKTWGTNGFATFIPTETGQTILSFVYLVGMIAFFRGILLLKNQGSPQGAQQGIGQAFTFIIGGALAMNVIQFSCVIASFVGTDMLCLTN